MKNVIFILGPTSSGKSRVAVELAERMKGEIISCDSMQVYNGMDVVTRPPAEDLLNRVIHHLVGTVPPEEEFNAARFVEEAECIIDLVVSSGGVPLITGGTGLYVKALVDGIFTAPAKDEELRRELYEVSVREGKESLYLRLKDVDPETARRLHPNDTRRVIRALEVYRLTGKPISEKKTESEGISKKYDCKMFGLSIPRRVLYNRIDLSVEKMFEEGLVEEVKRLRGCRLSLTAGKALGIREVASFLDGGISRGQAEEELKKNTRRYAKRQLTWFRADRRIVWIDAGRSAEEIAEDIAERLSGPGI